MEYYDWMDDKKVCEKCGWTGFGREAKVGECFNECAEYHCPKCEHYFGVVLYPTFKENLTDPRATLADRLFAEIVLSNVKPKAIKVH